MQKIICLVGEPSSGKGALVRILQGEGFSVLSLSAEVVSYTESLGYRGIPRSKMLQLANEARKAFGPDFFARPIVRNSIFRDSSLLVIDSIRNPAEIEFIRKSAGPASEIKIWSLQADPDLRYERTMARRYSWDPTTYEEFLENDGRELGSEGNPFSQQNAACIEMADVHLWNNGSLEELRKKVIFQLETEGILERPHGSNGKERE